MFTNTLSILKTINYAMKQYLINSECKETFYVHCKVKNESVELLREVVRTEEYKLKAGVLK